MKRAPQLHMMNGFENNAGSRGYIRLERQIAELRDRVQTLEHQLNGVKQQPSTRPQRPVETLPRTPRFEDVKAAPMQPKVQPQSFSAPSFQSAQPAASWSDRLRGVIGHGEWETSLASNLTNKIGALLVVIGVALFLGYSFERLTPAGRAGIAGLISTVILAAGVVIERRQQYRVFARGLIGAGWAALYTTAYAMYALPAAKVISNPLAGSILLLCVSTGIVAHSLRYRAQAVTAVAYFSAFSALSPDNLRPFRGGWPASAC